MIFIRANDIGQFNEQKLVLGLRICSVYCTITYQFHNFYLTFRDKCDYCILYNNEKYCSAV
jgi:hypothetical protein